MYFSGSVFQVSILNRFLRKKGAPRVPQLVQKSIKTVSQNKYFRGTWKSEKKWRFLRGSTSPKRCIYMQNQRFFTFSLDPVLSSKMPPKWGPWASQNEKKWCLKTDHFLVLFLERFLIKNDSKSDLKLARKYIKKTSKNRSRSRGGQGLIFDRFLMILGSIFECIFDNIYAWYAVFLALFSFVFSIGFGWYCCGIDVRILQDWYVMTGSIAGGLLWCCCGVTVGFLWLLCGSLRYYYY